MKKNLTCKIIPKIRKKKTDFFFVKMKIPQVCLTETEFHKTIIILTAMLEKSVPNKMNIILGSLFIISFIEQNTQIVLITNNHKNGNNGRAASINGLIFPVPFL